MCCFLALVFFSLGDKSMTPGWHRESLFPPHTDLGTQVWVNSSESLGAGGIQRAQLFLKDEEAGSCLVMGTHERNLIKKGN